MNLWYALWMFLALATGVLISRWTPPPAGLTRGQRLGIGFGAFCGAMLGAKLPFVFADWNALVDGSAWFSSGKTIMCGLVGGYLGVEIAKWILYVRVKTGDSFAVAVPAAVALGRLACFCGPCCYGTATALPWGVDFGDGIHRHPTQLYEFVFHAAAACVAAWMLRHQRMRGQLIKLYILSYLGYRFLTEFIRPEERMWAGLTSYQWAAIALVPLFVYLFLRDQNRSRSLVDAQEESFA